MAIYTANSVVKTLMLHKRDCRVIPWSGLEPFGCGQRGKTGAQEWWCEEHITREAVNELMKDKFWAILLCDLCFHNTP